MTEFSRSDDGRNPGVARGPAEQSTARDWAFCHLVILVIDAPTESDAVVAGREVYHRMTGCESTPFDEFQLVTDFDAPPSTFLTDRWGHLPGITSVTSVAADRLVDRAISRTGKATSHCPLDGHDTYLYDRSGDGIRSWQQFGQLIGTASDRVWLVPAITLHRAPSIDTSVSPF